MSIQDVHGNLHDRTGKFTEKTLSDADVSLAPTAPERIKGGFYATGAFVPPLETLDETDREEIRYEAAAIAVKVANLLQAESRNIYDPEVRAEVQGHIDNPVLPEVQAALAAADIAADQAEQGLRGNTAEFDRRVATLAANQTYRADFAGDGEDAFMLSGKRDTAPYFAAAMTAAGHAGHVAVTVMDRKRYRKHPEYVATLTAANNGGAVEKA